MPLRIQLVAAADGGGAGTGRVGAGARLGERPGADVLAGGEFRQVFLLLRFGAGEEDMVRAERIVRCDDDADRSVDGGKLFDGEHVVCVAEAGAAVFGGKMMPRRPICPSCFTTSMGNSEASSQRSTLGAISRAAKSRISRRRASWSSVRVKGKVEACWATWVAVDMGI